MCYLWEGLKGLDLFLYFVYWAVHLVEFLQLEEAVADRTLEKYKQNHIVEDKL